MTEKTEPKAKHAEQLIEIPPDLLAQLTQIQQNIQAINKQHEDGIMLLRTQHSLLLERVYRLAGVKFANPVAKQGDTPSQLIVTEGGTE